MAFQVRLDRGQAGVWVDYQSGARVKIRPLTKSKIRELRDAATVTRTEWQRGQRVEIRTLDDAAYDRALSEYLIEDWSGFEQRGVPIPCNPETKLLLMDQVLDFANFVADAALNIARYDEQRDEELTENLSDTSAG